MQDTPLTCEKGNSTSYTAVVRGVHHAKAPIVWVTFGGLMAPRPHEAERALRACAAAFLSTYDLPQTTEDLAMVAWHQPAGTGLADAKVIELPDGSIGFSYNFIDKRLLTANERSRRQ
jgi:23S rRNA A1618 N6-methylase RlmF